METRQAFIGREQELQRLHALLPFDDEAQGSIVLLRGETGVGKTAFARAFAAQAGAAGIGVVWGGCEDNPCIQPIGPWQPIIDDLERLRHEKSTGRISLTVEDWAPSVVSVPAPGTDASAAGGSPLEQRDPLPAASNSISAARSLLASELDAVARRRSVLVIVDDVQWVSRDALIVLSDLMRATERRRVSLLLIHDDTARSDGSRCPFEEMLHERGSKVRLTELTLRGLGREDLLRWIRRDLGESAPESLGEDLEAATRGNAFLALEMISAARAEAADDSEKGGGTGSAPAAPRSLRAAGWDRFGFQPPSSISRLVQRRLDRMTPETREILSRVSVFEQPFELRAVRYLVDGTNESLAAAIDESVGAGFLQCDDPALARYQWVHGVVRRTILGSSGARRIGLHRAAALALDVAYSGRERVRVALEIARQYEASRGLPGAEEGVDDALVAAQAAEDADAFEGAIRALELALALAERAEPGVRARVHERLALALAAADRPAEARRSAEAAVDEMRLAECNVDEQLDVITRVAARLIDLEADPMHWEPLVARGLEMVGERRDIRWARLAIRSAGFETLARGFINVGRRAPASPEAVEILLASSDEDDIALAFSPEDWRGVDAYWILDRAHGWISHRARIRALNTAARLLLFRHGDPVEAMPWFEDVLATSIVARSFVGRVEAMVQLATCRMMIGAFADARRTAAESKELVSWLSPRHRLRAVIAMALEASLGYYLDDVDWDQLASIGRGITADPKTCRTVVGPVTVAYTALASVRAGRPDEAERYLVALLPVLAELPPTTYTYNGAVAVMGTVAWELRLNDRAAELRRLVEGAIGAGVGDYPVASLHLTRARMSLLLDEPHAALAAFGDAQEQLERRSLRPLQAIALFDEGLARVKLNLDGSAQVLERAEAAFVELGMNGWAQRLRDTRAPLPLSAWCAIRCPISIAGQCPLTPKERVVLGRAIAPMATKEIAAAEQIAVSTVERHVANIYGKLDVHSRSELMAFAQVLSCPYLASDQEIPGQ